MTQATLFTPLARRTEEVALHDLDGVSDLAGSAATHSVAALGFVSAVLITPSTPGRYRILDGKRRAHDAQVAGHTHIPAIIVEGDAASLTATTVALNLCRRPNIADEARALKELIGTGGPEALKPIAKELGVSIHALRATARLLELPAELLAEIGDRISPSVARDLAALPEPTRAHAIQTAQDKLAEDDTARFTGDDLKAAKVAKGNALADLVTSAFATTGPVQPLAFATPIETLSAKIRQQAAAQGIELDALIAELKGVSA